MPALSQFTLVLLHVAHQVLFQAYYPFPDMIAVPAGGKNLVVSCAKCATLVAPEPTPPPPVPPGTPPPQPQKTSGAHVISITVPVDVYGNVVIVKDRIDSLYTSDTKVKTAIAAAVKGS